MKKFSVVIAGRHNTSFTLEEPFYDELRSIARRQNKSVNALVTEIDAAGLSDNLSSAIRIYILQQLKNQA